jgi:hypothetical protein
MRLKMKNELIRIGSTRSISPEDKFIDSLSDNPSTWDLINFQTTVSRNHPGYPINAIGCVTISCGLGRAWKCVSTPLRASDTQTAEIVAFVLIYNTFNPRGTRI